MLFQNKDKTTNQQPTKRTKMNAETQKKMNAAFSTLFTEESIKKAQKRIYGNIPDLSCDKSMQSLIRSLTHGDATYKEVIHPTSKFTDLDGLRKEAEKLLVGTEEFLKKYSVYGGKPNSDSIDMATEMMKTGAQVCVAIEENVKEGSRNFGRKYLTIFFTTTTKMVEKEMKEKNNDCSCGCKTTTMEGKMRRPASKCGARYFNAEHQVADWKEHKKNCEMCREYVKNKKL